MASPAEVGNTPAATPAHKAGLTAVQQQEFGIPRQVGRLLESFLGGELVTFRRCVPTVTPVTGDVVIVMHAAGPLQIDDLR